MDIVYYRKIAEIALSDGEDYDTRALGGRVLSARNPKRGDKRRLKAWMHGWIDRKEGAIILPE